MAGVPAAPGSSIVRPAPAPDEITRPFWDAADRQQLVIQRCGGCLRLSHPPLALCDHCLTDDFEFVPVSGRGTIESFTIVRDQRLPAFDSLVPFVVAHVQLEEDPGLVLTSNLWGAAPEDLRVGAPVQVYFEEFAPGRYLPQFQVAGETP